MLLVTGASGFVGRQLIPELMANGYDVILASRSVKIGSWIPTQNARYIDIEGSYSEVDWDTHLNGVKYIINLAGRAHILNETSVDPDSAFMAANCEAAVQLYRHATKKGVKGFLHISSIGVLGNATEPGQPFTDASKPAPAGPYARSKSAADEQLMAAATATSQAPALVILRPPLICGPGAKGNLERLLKLAAKSNPLPFGSVKNQRSLLGIANLVSAIQAVITHWNSADTSGTFVICDRETVSTGQIVAALREGLGQRRLMLPFPPGLLSRMLRSIGRGKVAEQLLGDLTIDPTGFCETFSWSPDVKQTLSC